MRKGDVNSQHKSTPTGKGGRASQGAVRDERRAFAVEMETAIAQTPGRGVQSVVQGGSANETGDSTASPHGVQPIVQPGFAGEMATAMAKARGVQPIVRDGFAGEMEAAMTKVRGDQSAAQQGLSRPSAFAHLDSPASRAALANWRPS